MFDGDDVELTPFGFQLQASRAMVQNRAAPLRLVIVNAAHVKWRESLVVTVVTEAICRH